ncbi:MAG TPA: hypothetical protein VEL51_08790 [Vicinamibacterales bacterium]|nr:hypothetical protein [Vicinamibacterales bacterium]
MPLNRIAAKAIQCFLLVAAFVFAACARILPDALGSWFWTLVWIGLALVTEPVAIILWFSRKSGEVDKPLAEWLRAGSLAAIPSAVLVAFWFAMWITFRAP